MKQGFRQDNAQDEIKSAQDSDQDDIKSDQENYLILYETYILTGNHGIIRCKAQKSL